MDNEYHFDRPYLFPPGSPREDEPTLARGLQDDAQATQIAERIVTHVFTNGPKPQATSLGGFSVFAFGPNSSPDFDASSILLAILEISR